MFTKSLMPIVTDCNSLTDLEADFVSLEILCVDDEVVANISKLYQVILGMT